MTFLGMRSLKARKDKIYAKWKFITFSIKSLNSDNINSRSGLMISRIQLDRSVLSLQVHLKLIGTRTTCTTEEWMYYTNHDTWLVMQIVVHLLLWRFKTLCEVQMIQNIFLCRRFYGHGQNYNYKVTVYPKEDTGNSQEKEIFYF